MATTHSPIRRRLASTPVVIAGIAVLVLLCFVIPFFGVGLSLVLPVATHAARGHLWPSTTPNASGVWSWIAWVGLWWPGVLSIFGPFADSESGDGGLAVSTLWLVIPSCGPDGTAAVLVPAAAVAGTALVGLLASVATKWVWPWVVALWLAPWVHHAVFSMIGPDYIC